MNIPALSLLLLLLSTPSHAATVATVGDSFADSLYWAIRARPDLLQRYGVQLNRWSRPIIGLTRADTFDYIRWLRDTTGLGTADLCLAQIGSNDMQSIPVSKKKWIPYGSPQWRNTYVALTREMAQVLIEHRCSELIWVLQPGFEKRDGMACHRELINEIQRQALATLDRTRVLEVATSETSYGPDQTHFSRAVVLQLGPALYQLIDSTRQIAHAGCLSCHRYVEGIPPESQLFPLRPVGRELAAPLWQPGRVGVQCRTPAPAGRERSRRRHRL